MGGKRRLSEFLGAETGQVEADIELLQFDELDHQAVLVPVGEPVGLIVSDPVCLDLGRRESNSNVDGDFFQSKLDGRLVAGVADNNLALLVHDNGLSPAELSDRPGDRVDSPVIAPRVVRVRPDFR